MYVLRKSREKFCALLMGGCMALTAPFALAADNASQGSQPKAAEAPAAGTVWRAIVGENFVKKTGVSVDFNVYGGVGINDTADKGATEHGNANLPTIPSDYGWQLDRIMMSIHRDVKGNIIPIITPLPGPMPKKVDWGFNIEGDYGRDIQGSRMAGWDEHWFMNEPGATTASEAAANRDNFFALSQVYGDIYLPVWKGMNVHFGRWGDQMILEPPLNFENGPNFFYSHTYTFTTDLIQDFGWLASVNLMNSRKNGLMLVEFGTNQGNSTLRSYSGKPMQSVTAGLRWRSPSMRTWLDFNLRVGDGNVKSTVDSAGNVTQQNKTDFSVSNAYVFSPRTQLKTQYELIFNQKVGKHWSFAAEGNYMKQAGDGKDGTWWEFGGYPSLIPVAKNFGGDHAVGINGRAVYKVNNKFGLGARIETLHDHNGYFMQPMNVWMVSDGKNPGNPYMPTVYLAHGQLSNVSVGVNYQPFKFLRMRPEFRHDWSDNPAYGEQNVAVSAGTAQPKKSQNMFAMDFLTWF